MAYAYWKESDKDFVRKNAGRLKDSEIAAILSRFGTKRFTVRAVHTLRAKLGIKKMPGFRVCRLSPPPAKPT